VCSIKTTHAIQIGTYMFETAKTLRIFSDTVTP
jgi:hypothetical protein